MITFIAAFRKSVAWPAIGLLSAFLLAETCHAATYYVDAAAASNSGSGSQSSPKKYISSGMGLLSTSGGDTLVIAPGTYANASDAISNLPAGRATAWNIIRAAIDGGVIIKASLNIPGGNHYVQFEGLRWETSDVKVITGNYAKFLRCAFRGGPASGNVVSVQVGTNDFTPGADHVLLEDSWVYGPGGRYKVLVYNATNIVLRRVVTRHDGGWSANDDNPAADITIYDSRNVAVLNPLAIDDVANVTNYVAAFYNVANGTTGTPNSTREWRGCLAIKPSGYLMGTEGQDTISGLVVTDCASYGGTFGVSQLKGNASLYQRMTVVNPGGDAFGIFGGSATVKDSVVVAPAGDDFNGISPQSSSTFPSLSAAASSGLKYLSRIEAGSALATGGSNGGQSGARILKRIGVSGTLYGESGYNVETADDLWPWPHEQRIKREFAEASTRGFAGSTLSMTDYIWSLLGSASPVDAPVEPNPPANVTVQ